MTSSEWIAAPRRVDTAAATVA